MPENVSICSARNLPPGGLLDRQGRERGGLLDKLQLVDDLVHVWALPVLRPVVHIDRAGGWQGPAMHTATAPLIPANETPQTGGRGGGRGGRVEWGSLSGVRGGVGRGSGVVVENWPEFLLCEDSKLFCCENVEICGPPGATSVGGPLRPLLPGSEGWVVSPEAGSPGLPEPRLVLVSAPPAFTFIMVILCLEMKERYYLSQVRNYIRIFWVAQSWTMF